MFIPLCLVLCSSLTQALPVQYRFEPLAREISLANLLDEKQTFTRAALNYYLDIFNDYKGQFTSTETFRWHRDLGSF